MAEHETDLRDTPIPEKSTALLSFAPKDEDDVALGSSQLTTLTLTLYNDRDETIINSRDAVDVLNANGGTLDGDGNGEWKMEELDNVIVQSSLTQEDHTAEFAWTYNGGADTGRHRVRLRVENFAKVS
jgi:hypothetical protein